MVQQNLALFSLLIIISISLLLPILLKRFRLPLISLMIISGAIFGPKILGLVSTNEILVFFGYLGMVFLMILAGSEIHLKKINENKSKVAIMSLLNGGIPFLFGFFIAKYYGYSLSTSILLGIVFISSSVAIIVPTLNSLKFKSNNSKKIILSSVLFSDIISLLLLAIIFHSISNIKSMPLYLYLPLLTIFLFIIFRYFPKFSRYFVLKNREGKGFELRLRFVLFVIFFLLLIFSILGLHAILAAFIIGLLISGLLNMDGMRMVKSKIHAIGYGLFVPVFFFLIGMEIDFSLFKSFDTTNIFMIIIIMGLLISKIISGILAGKIVGISIKDSSIFGIVSTVQLTTTLAVTYTASSIGLFDNVLTTSVILLSIITTLMVPILLNYLYGKNG